MPGRLLRFLITSYFSFEFYSLFLFFNLICFSRSRLCSSFPSTLRIIFLSIILIFILFKFIELLVCDFFKVFEFFNEVKEYSFKFCVLRYIKFIPLDNISIELVDWAGALILHTFFFFYFCDRIEHVAFFTSFISYMNTAGWSRAQNIQARLGLET